MKLGTSRRGTTLPALVAFMALASVSVAVGAGRSSLSSIADRSPSVVRPEPGHAGSRDAAGATRGDVRPEEADPSVDPDPCAAALETGGLALEQRHGLDGAIEALLANCANSPAARGLANALERLRRNRERQEANGHGGQQDANAGEHPGNAGSPPGREGAGERGGNGRGAGHGNGRASSSTHP